MDQVAEGRPARRQTLRGFPGCHSATGSDPSCTTASGGLPRHIRQAGVTSPRACRTPSADPRSLGRGPCSPRSASHSLAISVTAARRSAAVAARQTARSASSATSSELATVPGLSFEARRWCTATVDGLPAGREVPCPRSRPRSATDGSAHREQGPPDLRARCAQWDALTGASSPLVPPRKACHGFSRTTGLSTRLWTTRTRRQLTIVITIVRLTVEVRPWRRSQRAT